MVENTSRTSSDRTDREKIFGSLKKSIAEELQRTGTPHPLPIFFRADDIGVISSNFLRLLTLFHHFQLPLCLAVVPAWLTTSRWRTISAHIDTNAPHWCWHQHGWTHTNHQKSGKKCEFGSDRPLEAQKSDIGRGRARLESIIGASFYPAFTPPWNRCTEATVEILKNLGFSTVSRSLGEQKNPVCLPDCFINVDLHTRKENDPWSSFAGLLGEWRQAVELGRIGVMIHHQLMGEDDFKLLEWLLETTAQSPRLRACGFGDLDRS